MPPALSDYDTDSDGGLICNTIEAEHTKVSSSTLYMIVLLSDVH